MDNLPSLPEGATLDEMPPLPSGATLDPLSEAAAQPKGTGFWSSKAGRMLQGAAGPMIGAGQLATHATGFGKEYMDQLAQEASAAYQASRKEAGLTPENWDWWSGIGNIASPINYVPGGIASRLIGPAKTITQLAGRGAIIGGGLGAMQPVSDLPADESYAGRKFAQMTTGALIGAAAEPAVAGITNLLARTPQPFTKAGRAKFAAERGARRLGTLLEEGGEDPAKIRAAMGAPGAQGTVAEQTGSPTIAGIEQRLEAIDPVFAQQQQQARAQAEAAITGGAEQAVAGSSPVFLRDQAVAEAQAAQAALESRTQAATGTYEAETADIQNKLNLARESVRERAAQLQEQARTKFAGRTEELGAAEAGAQSQFETISAAVDDMVTEAEQHARNVATAFKGFGPEERKLANTAQAEILMAARKEVNDLERSSWTNWVDNYGHLPVTNKEPFLRSLAKSDDMMQGRKYDGEIQGIIDSWKESIKTGEPITGRTAQLNRSLIMTKGREKGAGPNPDLLFKEASKQLAEGIYESMSDIPGTAIPRAITKAKKDRFGQTFAGEVFRLGYSGKPSVKPELILEKAIRGEGPEAALRMRELEEATTPLTIKPRVTEVPAEVPALMGVAAERAKQVAINEAEKSKYFDMASTATDKFEKHYYTRMASDLTFRRHAEDINPKTRDDIIDLLGSTPPYTKIGTEARNIIIDRRMRQANPDLPEEGKRAAQRRLKAELTAERERTAAQAEVIPEKVGLGVGDETVVRLGEMPPMPGGRITEIFSKTEPDPRKGGTTHEVKYAKLDDGRTVPMGLLRAPGKIAPKPLQMEAVTGAGERPAAPVPPPGEAIAPTAKTVPSELQAAAKPLVGQTSDLSPQMRAGQERFLRIYAEKLVDPATGKMNANAVDTFIRDSKQLLQRFPGLQQDLEAASAAAREVKVVTQKTKLTKAEQKAELTRTISDIQNERAALKRASFDKLVSLESGMVNHARIDPFLRENAATLEKFPGLTNEIRNIAGQSRTLAEMEELAKNVLGREKTTYKAAMAGIKTDRDAIAKQAFSKLAAVEDPATVMTHVFKNSVNPTADLLEIARFAKAGGDKPMSGLRRLIFDQGAQAATKNGKLNFQNLHDFYFKQIGNQGSAVADVMHQSGVVNKGQMDRFREMLEKGIAHQSYKKNARIVTDVSTPIGALLEAAFRSIGAHYGALAVPGAGIHAAAAGARLATRALNIPVSRMENLFKQALEDRALMDALLAKATPKNAGRLRTVIRDALAKSAILGGVDIDERRPASFRNP